MARIFEIPRIKKHNFMKTLVLVTMMSLLLFSCKKDIEELRKIGNGEFAVVDWEPTFVAPLINTRTTLGEAYTKLNSAIKDLEEDNLYLSINSEDVFELEYKSSVYSPSLNGFYDIPTINKQMEVVVPQETIDAIGALPVGLPLTSSIYDTTLYFDIEPSYGALLEYIHTSGGEVNVTYNHNFNQEMGMNIKIRSITNRSTTDTLSFNFDGQASAPSQSLNATLDNHLINLKATDPNTQADIYNHLEIYVSLDGRVTNPTLSGNKFTIDFEIGSYFIDYIQGYLGVFNVNLPTGEYTLDIFEDLDLEGNHFKNPSVYLGVNSTLGLPLTLTIDSLDFNYENDGYKSLGVEGDVVNVIGVDYLSDIPSNPGYSEYLINSASQLDELLNTKPVDLKHKFIVSSFEQNQANKYSFFLKDTSHVRVDVTAKLPTVFSVYDYSRIDTTKLTFGDSLNTEEEIDSIVDLLDRAALKLVFENQLPFDVEAQAYIIDTVTGVVLDSLFSNGFHTILANTDIVDGIAQEAQDITTYIEIDQDKFESLLKGSHIVISTRGGTSGANSSSDPNQINYVKILSKYQFGIRAGVLAKFKVPVELDFSNDSSN